MPLQVMRCFPPVNAEPPKNATLEEEKRKRGPRPYHSNAQRDCREACRVERDLRQCEQYRKEHSSEHNTSKCSRTQTLSSTFSSSTPASALASGLSSSSPFSSAFILATTRQHPTHQQPALITHPHPPSPQPYSSSSGSLHRHRSPAS